MLISDWSSDVCSSDLLVDLGDDQYLAELTGHTITPENFLGIEINPRAAAIAQLVLWIGYLQWHFRVNGADRPPPEPILRVIPIARARRVIRAANFDSVPARASAMTTATSLADLVTRARIACRSAERRDG